MIRFCFARTLPVNIMKGVCVGCYLFRGTLCVHIHLFLQKSLAFLHNVMYHIHVEVGNIFCCQDWETFPVDRNTYFSNELNERETQVSFSFLLSKVLIFSTCHCIMYTWMLLLQRTLSDLCLWIEILVLKISKGKGDLSLFSFCASE